MVTPAMEMLLLEYMVPQEVKSRVEMVPFVLNQPINSLEDIRLVFGERIAMYFYFSDHLLQWMLPLLIVSFLYLLFKFSFSGPVWGSYMKFLSVCGFCIAIWGPSMIVHWIIKRKRWEEEWGVFPLHPGLDMPAGRVNVLCVRICTGSLLIFFVCIQLLMLSGFLHWYIYVKEAPLCTECTTCKRYLTCFSSMVSSFGSERWVYLSF